MTSKPLALAAIATASALAFFPAAAQAGAEPALGAITGASLASRPVHYATPYRYAPPVAHYPAPPVYYAPPVVYRASPVVVHHVAPRRPVYAPIVVARPHGRHHGHRHYRHGYGWR